MTPQKGKKFRTSDKAAALTITHRHAAGIDVHSAVHFVAVPVEDNRDRSGRRAVARWCAGLS